MSKLLKATLMFAAALAVTAVPAFAGEFTPVATVPEPATLLLLASGIGGLVMMRKIRK